MNRLSKELNEAICTLYEEREVGYNALGCGPEEGLKELGFQTEKNLSITLDPLRRVALLRRKLEDWVKLKGLEIDEFEGEVETKRIRYEALTTLMMLRDLAQYFPEVETASREDFESFKKTL